MLQEVTRDGESLEDTVDGKYEEAGDKFDKLICQIANFFLKIDSKLSLSPKFSFPLFDFLL